LQFGDAVWQKEGSEGAAAEFPQHVPHQHLFLVCSY
jgi:hypothetical protein